MDSPAEDKDWSSKYLLDPLNEPEPRAETGPGSHFTRPTSTSTSTSTSKEPSVTVSSHRKTPSSTRGYITPPASASPTQSTFHPSNPYSPSPAPNYRHSAFVEYSNTGPSRRSLDAPAGNGKGRRRGDSLGERFMGDMSHRPLEQIRKEAKVAHRAPHLRKNHIPAPDVVDSLDLTFGGPYHHDGPYDATLLARNIGIKNPPVAAVRESNLEALRATPRENIKDSLDRHLPLQGTAVIPPGMHGLDGRIMRYEEGADLMREPDAAGGAYKRWADVDYLPEDLKGKGEPSYTIEKALKEHKRSSSLGGTLMPDGSTAYEMQPSHARSQNARQRSRSNVDAAGSTGRFDGAFHNDTDNSGMSRSNSSGNKFGEGLKKRFGSMRRRKGKSVDV